MKISWNFIEFNEITKKLLPVDKYEELKLPLQSIVWKFNLCCYHIEEYKRIIQTIEDSFGDKPPAYKLLMDAYGKTNAEGEEKEVKIVEASFYAEAHVIAFAQAFHSMADILAKAINISLDLGKYFDNKEFRNISNVIKKLKDNIDAPGLIKAASKYTESDEFKYLKDYVNTTKHYSLVESNYSINFEVNQNGILLKPFGKHGNKWTNDFLGNDFEVLLEMFWEIGTELNNHIKINSLR